MRVIVLSAVVLCLLVGYSHTATIREGREGETVADVEASPVLAVIEEQKPVDAPEPIVSETRKVPEVVVEAVEPTVEEKTVEAIEEVAPVQQQRIAEPVVAVEDPVAIVIAEKQLVSEIKAEPVVAIVEPEVAVRNTEPEQPDVAVRNGQIDEEIVSELKSTPVQAVEEVDVPSAVVAEEPTKTEAEEAVAVKSVPVIEPEPEQTQPQIAEVPAVAINAKNVATEDVAAEVAPIDPVVAEPEEVVPAVKAVPVEQVAPVAEVAQVVVAAPESEVTAEVQPVEGLERQNVVAEGEQPKPTFFQQAQQVLTNNPITQFIANNPIANAIRGGTTAAPGTAEQEAPASSTTARPGIFAQLFNRDATTTAAPAVAADAQPTTIAPGFIQTAFSNIQNAPSNIISNLQNIFSGNRETTATPAAAAPAAVASVDQRKQEVEVDAPSSNAIDQSKKKRLDEEVELLGAQ